MVGATFLSLSRVGKVALTLGYILLWGAISSLFMSFSPPLLIIGNFAHSFQSLPVMHFSARAGCFPDATSNSDFLVRAERTKATRQSAQDLWPIDFSLSTLYLFLRNQSTGKLCGEKMKKNGNGVVL
jgi:hypothetical protein